MRSDGGGHHAACTEDLAVPAPRGAILCAAERVNALPSMLATVVLIPVAVTTSPTFIFVLEAVNVTLTLLLTAPFT